jgi:uncharacterized protein (DUF983 family)
MSPNHDDHAPRSLLAAFLRLRCPRCREGRLFRTTFDMADPCPVCGLLYEREPGYFMGALFCSYALALAVFLPVYLLLYLALPGVNLMLIGFICLILYLPTTPLIFRYARALWLYWDRWNSPSEVSTPGGWADWKKHHRPPAS